MSDIIPSIILIVLGFVIGYVAHVIVIMRYVNRMQKLFETDDIAQVGPRTVFLEKHNESFLVYDENDSFITQGDSINEVLLRVLGEDSSVKVLVKDQELQAEVRAFMALAEQDIAPSTNLEQQGTRQS